MDIDTRTQQLMGEHKETLARALATIEAGDPVIIDVPPASTDPQKLDLQTLEPIPCAGADCGTTTGEHSDACIAEHAAAVAGNASEQPPIDNDHVAPGAEQFAPDVIEGADAATVATDAAAETPSAQEPGEKLP